jgi:oligosaccharide repeat unit polymerase
MSSPDISSRSQAILPLLTPLLWLLGVVTICLLVSLRVVSLAGAPTWLLAVTSLGFVIWGAVRGDLLHPASVFGGLWAGCLAAASLRLLPLISDWSSTVWLCFLTALVSFPIGVWLGERISRRRSQLSLPIANDAAGVAAYSPQRRALVIASLCLGIGIIVLAYEYHLIGGIPILSDNPDQLRMELFGVAGQGNPAFDRLSIKLIHPFVEFTKYGAFLAFFVLLEGRPKSRGVIFCGILLILIGTLAYGSQAGRTFFVQIGVVGLALMHYLRWRIRLQHACLAVVLGFLFIAWYGSARIQKSGSAPIFEQALSDSGLPSGGIWDGVAFGYATVTISFEVFARLTEDLRYLQTPAAGFLFYAFHRIIPRSNIQEFALNLYSGESITPTFLGEFYMDYRYWGVLFGTLVFGLSYGVVYSRSVRKQSYYQIYVRALFLQMLIFFPYVNLFSQLLTWIFDLFFMYWLLRWSFREAEGQLSWPIRQLPRSGVV